MGTRNLTVVLYGGEPRVAQYGQWDGYPTGQGKTICEFIQNEMDLEKFKEAVAQCEFISTEEIQKRWKEVGADDSGFVNMKQAKMFGDRWPWLDRDTGAKVLGMIQKGTAKQLKDSLEFAKDSLFCEWAYVVDLDNENLEVYKGFNRAPLNEGDRFYTETKEEKEYQPVKLFKKIPFSDCTPTAMKELETELEEEE